MHRRVVAGVSAVLFTLLAVMAAIVTDLHDRDFPVRLGAESSASLDFAVSNMSDQDAFRQLGDLSDRLDLGLVRVAPDLRGDQSGEVFVVVGSRTGLPGEVGRFGDEPDATVESRAALEHSYASGRYLLTGSTTHRSEFQDWLTQHQVGQRWTDDSTGTAIALVARQGSFATSLVAGIALMVSLVLYWLSVKAKGRALRVLAGVPTWRVQYEDLVGFLAVMTAAAVVCDLGAATWVGLSHGWVFVPDYARLLLASDALVLSITAVCAVGMSLASRPTVRMLAAREPAVKSLRRTSMVLKAATFVLVLAAVAPALDAYTDSKQSAAQQAQWKSLADEVAVQFQAGMGEAGFERITHTVGDLVGDAEGNGSAALSYTWSRDLLAGDVLGSHDGLSLVNQEWLDLMLGQGPDSGSGSGRSAPGLTPLSWGSLPQGVQQFLDANVGVWVRDGVQPADVLSSLSFFEYSGPTGIPAALAGNGDLFFPEHAVVAVASDLHGTFNDDFLASTASSRNLVFTGLGPTEELVQRHGLQGEVFVKYVAEEGVLRAQFTAYFAWLQGVSLAALVVALVVSTFVGAFITAMLKARRDFPLHLAGKRWGEILADRLVKEGCVGVVLAVLVLLAQGSQSSVVVSVAGALGLLTLPLTHVTASRWTFNQVSLRNL